MIVTVGAAMLTLRAGLALRRARRLGSRPGAAARRRHLRLAKPTIALALIGFTAGPISMALIRGRTPFETAHAFLASATLMLFVSTAFLGRRLETGRGRARNAHAALGVMSLLAACSAAVAGFVLLP